MNGKLTIPDSQQLRFINKTYYQTTPIRYDTRLFADFYFLSRLNTNFCQKLNQGDDLVIQFRTSYIGFNLTLYKANSIPYINTDYNGEQYQVGSSYVDEDEDTMRFYNIPIDTSSLDGIYFFTIQGYTAGLPVILFQSEPFEIKESFENTKLIKFGGNESVRDGMRWSDVQYIVDYWQYLRLECKIIEPSFGSDKNTFTDSDSELTNLNNYPKATHLLDLNEVPFWIVEKLTLALQHDYFEIDGMQYAIDEDFEATNFKQKQTCTGSIPLRQVKYQNYVTDEILVGENPVIPSFALWAEDGKALWAETGKAIGYY